MGIDCSTGKGETMKVSVIIVSFNAAGLLRECLRSLFQTSTRHELEVVIVDNDSADDSVAMMRESFPQVILLENNWNAGFAAGVNQGYAVSSGDYVFLFNPDARLKPGAIDRAVDFMEAHPECGICGARLVNPAGGLEPSARRFPSALYKFLTTSGLSTHFPHSKLLGKGDYRYFDHNSVLEVDWVPGTFSAIRRTMLEQLGFFDERFYLYYEETDLCLRAKRRGWKIYFIPDAEVVHEGGGCSKTRKDLEFDTGGSQLLKFRMRSEMLYFRKNFGISAVIANAGVEMGWHVLRALVNLRPGKESQVKRRASIEAIRHDIKALKETQWGSYSPPKPW